MREGVNPVKYLDDKNTLKPHRIVVVFYILDDNHEYFEDLHSVLDKCLTSLFLTIDIKNTNVTLINNNSSEKVNKIVDKFKNKIDKYVYYTENKGKVYAVINEARSVLEPFITISDADIFFFPNWEKEVFNIFLNFPKAGVVSPIPKPYLTFYFNQSVFGMNSILGKIKYGKYVHDIDIELYLKGTNLPNLIIRKGKKNWKEKQFILTNNKEKAVIGAYHVISTYRIEQFRNIYTFPELKFINSYEAFFIDYLADRVGLFRLSTLKTYAYHMGNKLDETINNVDFSTMSYLESDFYNKILPFKKNFSFYLFLNRIIGRVFIKFKWNFLI